MKYIKIDNYIVTEPLVNILLKLQFVLTNGKLRDIHEKADEIIITCPNDDHDGGHEQNPDCHVNISKKDIPYGTFNCFACGASGSFVKLVALCFSSSIDFAKKWLIDNYGELSSAKVIVGDLIELHKNKRKTYLDEVVLENYLHWTPYLQKRKLSRNVCEFFKVRYDPKYRQVIFPVYNKYGKLVMLAKRSVDTKMFYMDDDVKKEVYCLDYIIKNNIDTCIITEGPIDCLTAYTYNFPAVATLGAVSDYQIAQINSSCIKTLYLCMDNDEAGKKFTDYLSSHLDKRILLKKVKLPAGKKDINDLTKDELVYCLHNCSY